MSDIAERFGWPEAGLRVTEREPSKMGLFRSPIAAAVAGAVSWTAAEYGLHRFAMHELRGKGLASVEHLKHHADVTYFSPTSKKLASAAAAGTLMWPAGAKVVGPRRSAAFTAGFLATYFAYEAIHRRLHTHGPRTRYGRWARRNHFHHHFGAPMRNFGVTVPVWDAVFRSAEDPGLVTVPRRMAPVWLLDADGEVRPELAADYAVKGRADVDADQRERDRIDAFANVAPDAA